MEYLFWFATNLKILTSFFSLLALTSWPLCATANQPWIISLMNGWQCASSELPWVEYRVCPTSHIMNLLYYNTNSTQKGQAHSIQCLFMMRHYISVSNNIRDGQTPIFLPYLCRSQINKLCGRPPQYAPISCKLTFDIESGVRVTCDVGYLCANFSLPRLLCSRLMPDVCDRQTSNAHHCLMPPPYGGGGITRNLATAKNVHQLAEQM